MGKWDKYVVEQSPADKWKQYEVGGDTTSATATADVNTPTDRTPDLLDQFLPTGVASMGRGPANFQGGDLNLLGDIFNRPGAAIRSALMGKGYVEGAKNPNAVPRFQDVALDKYYNAPDFAGKELIGNIVSAGGMVADVATNPADLLALLAGKTPMGGRSTLNEVIANSRGGQAVGRFMNMPIEETAPARYTSDTIKGLANQIKKSPQIISKIRDYPANKVNSIRNGFWNEYAPKEWKAYGDAIESLPNERTSLLNGERFIQSLESKMKDRGLIALDGTMQKAFRPSDSKLIKAYDSISKKWADSPTGELNIKDIVDEYKNLKGNYSGKPTSSQRANIEVANDFFNSASDQIDAKAFTLAKIQYGKFKDNQQLIHESINLYGPEMKTARGEKWLMEGPIGATTQGRKTAQMITKTTGQALRGAKTMSTINRVPVLKYITKNR